MINKCCYSTINITTTHYKFKCKKVSDAADWDYYCRACGTKFMVLKTPSNFDAFMQSLVEDKNG